MTMLSGEGITEAGTRGIETRKTVTVTLRNGQTLDGRLSQIDDFPRFFTDADGNYHSFPRQGDYPKVVIKDPLQPHLDMLLTLKTMTSIT